MSYRSQSKGTNYRKPKALMRQTLSPVPKNHLKTKTGVDLSKSTTDLGGGMTWVGDSGLDNEELVERTKALKAGQKWEPPVSGFCPKCKAKHKPPEPPEGPDGEQPPQPPPKVTEIDESHSGEDSGGGGGGQQQQQPPPPQKGKGKDKDEEKEEKDDQKGKDGEGKDDKKDKDTKEGEDKKDGKGQGQDKKDPQDTNGQTPNGPQTKGKQQPKDGKPQDDGSEKKPYVPEGAGEEEEEPDPDAPTPEDIQKAKQGGDEVKGEFDQASTKVDLDVDTPDFESVASAADPTLYRDTQFMAEMNTALKDWKTGYETKTGASGSRLSVKQFIKTVGNEPFLTRIQKSAKGRKILFLLDFSGSQNATVEEYKKAVVSTSEVLDGIGSFTAMFAFGSQAGQDHEANFLRIKRFEEQKWMPVHSARVSALEAGGSTPTHAAYRALNTYIRRHKPDVVITLTDGEPDEPEDTTKEIQRLRPVTKMVAFGIGDSLESAQKITEKLSKYGYNRVFGVTGVAGLPSKIVGLIAPK